jgi:hypothetical protein
VYAIQYDPRKPYIYNNPERYCQQETGKREEGRGKRNEVKEKRLLDWFTHYGNV